MSETEAIKSSNALKRAGVGLGRDGDKIVGLATVLAAGLNEHYGIELPLHEIILPAAALVGLIAHKLANYCKTLEN